MRWFSRLPKRDPDRMRGENAWQRFARILIIALLFCGVLWGIWLKGERLKSAPVRQGMGEAFEHRPDAGRARHPLAAELRPQPQQRCCQA